MKIFWAVFFAILAAAAVIALATGALHIATQLANAPSLGAVNAMAAVGSLQTINTAEMTYTSMYDSSYSPDLASLQRAGLIDDELASGKKLGYLFRYVAGRKGHYGNIMGYTLTARPERYRETGLRSFYTDESGVIRETSADREPTKNDPFLAE
jgi:hypothetical protein